jgi:hypothetical protein
MITLSQRGQLPTAVQVEFDQLTSSLQAMWDVDHDLDGKHKQLTPSASGTSGALTEGGVLTLPKQPRCRLYVHADTVVADSTSWSVQYDYPVTEDGLLVAGYDVGRMLPGQLASQVKVPSSGVYFVNAQVLFDANSAAGSRFMFLGVIPPGSATFDTVAEDVVVDAGTADLRLRLSAAIHCVAGSQLFVSVIQYSGSDVTIQQGLQYGPTYSGTWLEVVKLF